MEEKEHKNVRDRSSVDIREDPYRQACLGNLSKKQNLLKLERDRGCPRIWITTDMTKTKSWHEHLKN